MNNQIDNTSAFAMVFVGFILSALLDAVIWLMSSGSINFFPLTIGSIVTSFVIVGMIKEYNS